MKKKEIMKALNESIQRLEEALINANLDSDSEDIEFKVDSSLDVTDNIEGAGAELMIAEGRIEEMTQVLSEEIDSLRTLMEKIEEEIE